MVHQLDHLVHQATNQAEYPYTEQSWSQHCLFKKEGDLCKVSCILSHIYSLDVVQNTRASQNRK